jgi:hypothetical protein
MLIVSATFVLAAFGGSSDGDEADIGAGLSVAANIAEIHLGQLISALPGRRAIAVFSAILTGDSSEIVFTVTDILTSLINAYVDIAVISAEAIYDGASYIFEGIGSWF